jgi:hypothetical protein
MELCDSIARHGFSILLICRHENRREQGTCMGSAMATTELDGETSPEQ